MLSASDALSPILAWQPAFVWGKAEGGFWIWQAGVLPSGPLEQYFRDSLKRLEEAAESVVHQQAARADAEEGEIYGAEDMDLDDTFQLPTDSAGVKSEESQPPLPPSEECAFQPAKRHHTCI